MNRNELLLEIKNALQREDDLTEDTMISDIKEWDSLSMISVISLYDSLFSISLPYNELSAVQRIKDLIDKAKDKLI